MAPDQRSPRFPSVGLEEALRRAQLLWEQQQRSVVEDEVAVRDLGYTSLSGPSRSMLGAMKRYQLLEGAQGTVSLTELAIEALQGETESDRANATMEAARNPELFRNLFESHTQASEDAIRAHLITRRGFTRRGADQAAAAFVNTRDLVASFGTGYNSPVDEDNGSSNENNNNDEPDRDTPMISGEMRTFDIPLPDSAWVSFTVSYPLSTDAWNQLLKVLDLYKAGLVQSGDASGGGSESVEGAEDL